MNYRVQFLRITKDYNEDKKLVATGEIEYLGEVTISDAGTSNNFPLVSKAFRHAAEKCQMADKTVVTRL